MYVTLPEILPVTMGSLDDYIGYRFPFKIVVPYPDGPFSLKQENDWLRERQDWCSDNIGLPLNFYDDEYRFMVTPNCYNTDASWHQNHDHWRFHRERDATAFKIRWG